MTVSTRAKLIRLKHLQGKHDQSSHGRGNPTEDYDRMEAEYFSYVNPSGRMRRFEPGDKPKTKRELESRYYRMQAAIDNKRATEAARPHNELMDKVTKTPGKGYRMPRAQAQAIEGAEKGELKGKTDIEIAHIVDKDGKTVLRKTGDKDSVTFSEGEMAKARGSVLTHNHPSGNSFSGEDIMTGATNGLTAVRAVSATDGKVYQMTFPQGLDWSKEDNQRTLKRTINASYKKIWGHIATEISHGKLSNEQGSAALMGRVWRDFSEKWPGFVYEEL